jgi:UDPglucose 6-dehydrogenase
MRDAPSIAIVQALKDAGARIRAYDPKAIEQAQAIGLEVGYASDPYSCVKGASAVVMVTEWESFRALDLTRLRHAMAEPILVDLRNIYRPGDALKAGFRYLGVGVPLGSHDTARVLPTAAE